MTNKNVYYKLLYAVTKSHSETVKVYYEHNFVKNYKGIVIKSHSVTVKMMLGKKFSL